MDKICAKDQTLFEPASYVDKETGLVGGLFLLEGVDFLKLWSTSFNTAENQTSIWKYLQLLTIIGRKIVPNKAEVLEMLNSVGSQVQAPAKVEKTLLGADEDLGDAGNKPDMFGLGNLASLAGLMGLGGRGESGGLTDMLKSVGDMFSGIDLKGIAEEMQKAQAVGEARAETLTGADAEQPNNESEQASEPTATEQGSGAATNLFVDMAQEMANTFDFSQLESGDQPANMADAFKKLMSGDNPKKIAGLISKFGNKIQGEIASGKLNQADLLKQTTQMMPGMGGAADGHGNANFDDLKKHAENFMKANPAFAAQAEQLRKQQQKSSQGGMTKDRLRAKLEAKRKTEQGDQPK
jgi:hypothetical protein